MKITKYLKQSPAYSLYQANLEILEPLQKGLSAHGLHFLQGLILTSLFFEERDIRPSELSQTFQIDRSTLSHALRGLEKKGWIKRMPHPKDARGYLFSLTTIGRKKSTELIKLFDQIDHLFESQFGTKKSNIINDGIQDLIQCFRTQKEKLRFDK